MKKLPMLICVFGLISQSAFATETARNVQGFSSPESAISDGKLYYISNVGEKLAPSAKDSDGFISTMSLEGEVLEKKFLPSGEDILHAPKAMAIIGNMLYVTDVDTLKGFELTSKKQVFSLDFSSEKTAFLNDIAVKDNHTLFVSSSDTHKIYQVNLQGKGSFTALDIPQVHGANGLAYDKEADMLYVAGFGSDNKPNGKLGKITLGGSPSYTVLADKEGYFDGIVQEKNALIFSDWGGFEGKQGKFYRYDLATGEISDYKMTGSPLGGPADFMAQAKGGFIIPAMLDNTVLLVKGE